MSAATLLPPIVHYGIRGHAFPVVFTANTGHVSSKVEGLPIYGPFSADYGPGVTAQWMREHLAELLTGLSRVAVVR